MPMNPIDGLRSASPRNRNLNAAYAPQWADPGAPATVDPGPSGDTQFDPFQGTGWDRWLDAAGAKQPGGMNLGSVKGGPREHDMLPNSPISGLMGAQPQVQTPQPQAAAPNELELRQRRARMLNQSQPAANFTPNAGGYNPYPGS
jgi:hypothetical protein